MAIILVFAGCAWFQPKEEKSSQELARDGMEAFQARKYDNAIESFEKLKDYYPFSKFAMLAELKIADSHFHLKQYDEAIFAYEEFERLHPRNEAIPYVIYQIGYCYYQQMDTVDRDQTSTQKALEAFERLTKQFPNDSHTVSAKELILNCLKTLAGHEFYVGYYYYKMKHYKAALHRFKNILTYYPDVGLHYKALQYITLCEASIKKIESKN